MIHKTINTLPIDCYMLIQESISKGTPDLSFLVARQNYYEPIENLPSESELLDAWQSIIYSFGEGQLNNKISRLHLDIQIILNKMLITGNEDLKFLIEQKVEQIESEKQKEGFDIEDFYDNCTQIATHLHINLIPFQTTTRQYHSYIKEINRRSELINRKKHGK